MTPDITTTRAEFITFMGQVLERHGLPPIAGRILGLLIFDGEARSFSDLATELGVSRGSISANTRHLMERGTILREKREGDRQDYFRVTDRSLDAMLEDLSMRMQDASDRATDFVDRLPEGSGPRKRVGGLANFYGTMAESIREAARKLGNCS